MTQISAHTQKTLDALRKAVTDTLERKRRLGHYAIVWRDDRPVAIGEDAPDDIKGMLKPSIEYCRQLPVNERIVPNT